MAALALDTYAIAKRLRDSGFTEDQAAAVTDAVRQSHDVDLTALATKADLLTTKSDLKAEVSDAKTDLLKWVIGAIGLQTVAVLGGIAAIMRLLTP